MRSLDLTSERARRLLGESLGTQQSALRALGLRTVTWLRLVGGGAFAVMALLLGVVGSSAGWRAVLAPLLTYVVLIGAGAILFDHPQRRQHLLVASALVDLAVVFLAHLLPLPASSNPQAVANLALGGFALVVVIAALTLESPRLVAGSAVLAWLLEGALLVRVGAAPSMLVAAGLLLGLTGVLAALAVARLRQLAAQLVSEEVHRRLATERGRELERANERVALINAELEEQQQRLVLAQRDAETMTSLIVHDMKQPLSSVLALIELVASEVPRLPEAGPLLQDLGVARAEAQRLLSMIGDLLAISRLERGTLQLRLEPTPLAPLLQAVAGRAQRPRATVAVRAPAGLVAPLDPELTGRMLDNLLANALAFVRPGGAVELSAERIGADLVLAVKNDGPPVPAEVRPGLFEKLVNRGGERHNAGLGLYFCRLVAEAHRGRIALEGDPAFAVAFVARLPVEPGRVRAPPEKLAPAPPEAQPR